MLEFVKSYAQNNVVPIFWTLCTTIITANTTTTIAITMRNAQTIHTMCKLVGS